MTQSLILQIHLIDIYIVDKLDNDARVYSPDAFDWYTIYKLDNGAIVYTANTLY